MMYDKQLKREQCGERAVRPQNQQGQKSV